MSGPRIHFKLFISGSTPRSELAISNLDSICREVFGSSCDVEVIDALDRPELAEQEKVLATPTLIKDSPGPRRRVTGDLSDTKKVIQLLMLTTGTGGSGT
jgi:circadian clock protein KaiB